MFKNYIYLSLCNNPLPTCLPPLFSVFLLLSFYIILLYYSLTYFFSENNSFLIKVLCFYQKYQHAWKYWTNVWELLYTMQYNRQPPFNVSIILFPSFTSLEYGRETHGASEVVIVVKNPPANAGDIRDPGSIPESERSGGGHGNLFQYFCLWNPMDRGACQSAVHTVTNSWTQLKQ